jgi:hypothetical protein
LAIAWTIAVVTAARIAPCSSVRSGVATAR